MPWIVIGPRNSYEVFVDDDDLYIVQQRHWRYQRSRSGAAVVSQVLGDFLTLSRVIMDAPPDKVVDHIDGNPLNNSRSNLRICTRAENARNMVAVSNIRDRRSRYPNSKKPWEARITYNYKCLYLGMYATREEAQHAVDDKKQELYGDFAPRR